MYQVNKLGYKWTLNGVAFSCSSARVNYNELRIMFGFLVPSYSPATCLPNCTVSHPSSANISLQWAAQISTTSQQQQQQHLLTCSQTPWQTDKLLTHTTTIYLNLQPHINQILAEISRTCWVSYKLKSEVLKVVIMMMTVTLVQPL